MRNIAKIAGCVICLFISKISYDQIDTTGVLIIGDNSDNIGNENVVIGIDEKYVFKFELAKIFFEESTFASEIMFSRMRASIEPEITILWNNKGYFFDLYTNNNVDYLNSGFNFSDGFFSDINWNFGAGVTLKHYLSKKKSGPYGLYVGAKVRSRYGRIIQSYTTIQPLLGGLTGLSSVKKEYKGNFFISEISPIIGYSFWVFQVVQIEPFVGPSIAFINYKYGILNDPAIDDFQTQKKSAVMPTIQFGLRIGISSWPF